MTFLAGVIPEFLSASTVLSLCSERGPTLDPCPSLFPGGVPHARPFDFVEFWDISLKYPQREKADANGNIVPGERDILQHGRLSLDRSRTFRPERRQSIEMIVGSLLCFVQAF